MLDDVLSIIKEHRKHLTMYIQYATIDIKGGDNMAQINLRIDEDVKESAEHALKDMGLNMSTAITMFLTKVGRERRIPFEITADPFYSEKNIRYLEQIAEDVRTGKAKFREHEMLGEDE